MRKILQVTTPDVYASYVGAPLLHPLVSVIHYDELSPFRHSLNNYWVYGLFIQKEFPKNLSYGVKPIAVNDAAIIAVAPGQIGGSEDNGERLTLRGWVLMFSPELLRGTDLESRINDYRYFSYFATDALPVNMTEWDRISRILELLREELRDNEDSPALRAIVLGYVRTILEYCNRIWTRQLSGEDKDSSDILKRLHAFLIDYYDSGQQYESGVPSVGQCASALSYSPHYLGNMVRKASGNTAIRYIHSFVTDRGKSLLVKGYNVNETARMLGFGYPHHFTRMFTGVTGVSPTEFLGKKD